MLTTIKEIKVSSLHHRISKMRQRMPRKERSRGMPIGLVDQ
jgi:hypothetical protein